jgi:hypothetical protein
MIGLKSGISSLLAPAAGRARLHRKHPLDRHAQARDAGRDLLDDGDPGDDAACNRGLVKDGCSDSKLGGHTCLSSSGVSRVTRGDAQRPRPAPLGRPGRVDFALDFGAK